MNELQYNANGVAIFNSHNDDMAAYRTEVTDYEYQ